MTTRVGDVVRELEGRELDALLVTDLVNLRWLTGFSGSNGAAIVGGDHRLFWTDFRYGDQAEREVGEAFERRRAGRSLLSDLAGALRGRVGFDDANLSVGDHRTLSREAKSAELVPAGGLIEGLRAVKDAGELDAIRAAATLADNVLSVVAGNGIVGRTETEVAWALEREMRERGAEAPSFPPIVAAGANGALPHARPGDIAIPPETLVVVDMGCILGGYCSDCTRTFATGEPGQEAREVYEVVRSAQAAACEAVRAGAECTAVDAVARDLIESAGYGEYFGHGLGHGVGLEVHEAPRLSPSGSGELVAGNVVTVEPGIYLPGRFGVRIEDLVIVGNGSMESLTPFSKDLVEVG